MTSLSANVVSSAAMTMSQTAARPTPPPSAAPCTRAMTGIGSVSSLSSIRTTSSASRRFSRCVYAIAFDIQPMSAPAQNVLPLPASTIARSAGSSAASVAAALRAAMSSSSNALRTSGRFSVRRRTGPSRSLRMEGISGVCYIRNTPNFGTGMGALNAADSPSASAARVSAGSRMPSSHRRAVE